MTFNILKLADIQNRLEKQNSTYIDSTLISAPRGATSITIDPTTPPEMEASASLDFFVMGDYELYKKKTGW
jgi:hypothetical protein